MLSKKILNHRSLISALIVFTGFLIFIFYFARALPLQSSPALSSKNTKIINQGSLPISEVVTVNSGLPIRLKIPKIKVDSAIESVGLTSKGAMDVPKRQENVAWFNLGTRPGNNGSAVMAGHYGWKDKKPSVFDNLYKLRSGDKIYVEDDKGIISTFVVRESRRYTPSDNAAIVFGSSDGQAHLNLITCEGTWNKIAKSYPKRLVIFADKE